jgi:hypothetical protein
LITLFFNVSKDCVRFECRALFGPVDALFPCTLGVRNSFFIVDLTRLGPGLVTSAGGGGLWIFGVLDPPPAAKTTAMLVSELRNRNSQSPFIEQNTRSLTFCSRVFGQRELERLWRLLHLFGCGRRLRHGVRTSSSADQGKQRHFTCQSQNKGEIVGFLVANFSCTYRGQIEFLVGDFSCTYREQIEFCSRQIFMCRRNQIKFQSQGAGDICIILEK